ncbi:regulatory inactivation of DnaA Hda protein [Paraburkholderia lycopersici]|uniref:Regulatory inactivation of DnaA Hda protein n=1 Tax=Paraburkholderia lycopersici TaxID=416944 RepID=A0A1G6GMP1_9BURK|nr:regulatory inactivation of DnaA Hda protein [Paraburkholderia lycopersici]
MQRQLTLDLGTPPPSTFDNFHIGANAELVARLRGLDAALMAGPIADRTFYVWGEPGNGRSHLLQALAHEAPPGHVRYLGPQSALAAFTFDPRVTIYAIDDCDSLSGAQQIALFNLFNEVRAYPGCALVATGNAPPMGLAVREDLRTRLGWGLVFHLAPLSDEGKAAILKLAARERGIALADDVPAYLLTHFRRDMPSLMGLLDALDRFSLEQKRAVTLPLLRTMLANGVGDLVSAASTMAADDGRSGEEPAATDHAGEPATRGGPAEDQGGGNAAQTQPVERDDPPAPAAGAPEGPAAGSDAAQPYEAPKAPALQARTGVSAPFSKPTDNVEGELGAKYRHVVHKELGAELKGEVEADVSNEMTGELRGDLDPPAGPAVSDASAGEASSEHAAAMPGAPCRPKDQDAPDTPSQPPNPPESPAASAPDAPASPTDPAAPTPPAGNGNGNGITRFK